MPVPPAISASSTTTLGNSFARPASALPNASRKESPLVPIRAGASADIEQFLDFVGGRIERFQRFLGLFTREFHAAMPLRLSFHVRNAFAFCGVADENRGTALRHRGTAQPGKNASQAVPINFGNR